MSVEYSTDLYYGCRIDDYYDTILDIAENFPDINTITKEEFESLCDDYVFYLNSWSDEGTFLGTCVKTNCKNDDTVIKLFDYVEATNLYEREPDEEFENFVKVLRELIPDLPPLTYCIVNQLH